MKSVKNKVLVLLMATIIFICPIKVFANDLVFNENELKSINAGANLTIIINEILNLYKGDVTIYELYEAAIIGMTNILDSFSNFISKENFLIFTEDTNGNIITYGFMVEQSEGNILVYHVFEGSNAESLGMVKGDIVKSINNKDVKGLSLDEILNIVTLNPSDYLQVDIIRDDKILRFTLKEEVLLHSTVTVKNIEDIIPNTSKNNNHNIRYVQISTIGEDTAKELENHIKNMKNEGVEKIILDLRGNFGGYLEVAVDILDLLLDEGTIMFIVDNDNNKEEIIATNSNYTFNEIIVLVDANTASSAEIIAATLQDTGSTVVGSTTYGKGLIQTALELPSGDFLMLTTHESLRITGQPLNDIGVKPDIYIKLPDFIIQTGASDIEVFAKAMDILEFIGYEVEDKTNPSNERNITAIKEFQAKHGINTTGFLDEKTIDLINETLFIIHFENDIVLNKAYNILYNY